MIHDEVNKSISYLKEVKRGKLVSVGRASSLAWFLFVKDNDEYALHLQTGFRVVANENILFASADIFQPSEELESREKFDLEAFEWDIQGNNRYDEKVNLFVDMYPDGLTVNDISINQFGDLSIWLSENIKIEVFVNMSKEECWRFFKRHSDKHLVITGAGIDYDE